MHCLLPSYNRSNGHDVWTKWMKEKMGFFTFEKCFLLIWLFCVIYIMVWLYYIYRIFYGGCSVHIILVYCKVSNGRLRTFISCLNALAIRYSERYIYRNRTMSFANILFKFLPPSLPPSHDFNVFVVGCVYLAKRDLY